MKLKSLLLPAVIAVVGLSLLLFPRPAAEAKGDLLKKLQLLRVASLIEPTTRRFSAGELEELRRALPSVKVDNPKLYKDPRRTEKILLLYMILAEIEHAAQSERGAKSLAGKSPGLLARAYVDRVFKAEGAPRPSDSPARLCSMAAGSPPGEQNGPGPHPRDGPAPGWALK